jgi:hypothetical protein
VGCRMREREANSIVLTAGVNTNGLHAATALKGRLVRRSEAEGSFSSHLAAYSYHAQRARTPLDTLAERATLKQRRSPASIIR